MQLRPWQLVAELANQLDETEQHNDLVLQQHNELVANSSRYIREKEIQNKDVSRYVKERREIEEALGYFYERVVTNTSRHKAVLKLIEVLKDEVDQVKASKNVLRDAIKRAEELKEVQEALGLSSFHDHEATLQSILILKEQADFDENSTEKK